MQICSTKDNHFVPQFYLKNFTNSENFISCYDKKTKKYYKVNDLKEIASKKNLYTIKNKISLNDLEIFKDLFEQKIETPLEQDFIRHLFALLNDDFKSLFTIKYEKDKNIEQKINLKIANLFKPAEISRNQELLFRFYEQLFQPLYQKIITTEALPFEKDPSQYVFSYLAFQIMSFSVITTKQKIYSILKNNKVKIIPKQKISNPFSEDSYINFIHYLVIQYLRTKKRIHFSDLGYIQKELTVLSNKKFDINNVMFLYIHFCSLNITQNLINSKYKLILINNLSNIPFITSDNPAVNPFSSIISPKTIPDGYEIFLPLSPKLGVLYTKICLYKTEKDIATITEEKQITYWNDLIFKSAERYIYSNTEEIFKKI